VEVEHLAHALAQALGREQVVHAHRAPADLVLVGGPDAATGGADLGVTALGFASAVERDVVRQNQGAGAADAQPFAHRHAGPLELVDLGQQRLG
jgi:hypothetical protein